MIVFNLIAGCIIQAVAVADRQRETANPFAWVGIKIRPTYDYFMR